MQPEQRQWIKRCIFDNLAPAHNGKISMALLTRLFSDYGDSTELRNIMNEFVADNQAKIVQRNGNTFWILTDITCEIGRSIVQDLKKLEKETHQMKSNIEATKRELNILDDASIIWQRGWEQIFKDSDSRALVTNYVTSFWSEQQHQLLGQIEDQTKRLTDLEERMSILKGKIDESYEDQ